MDLLYQPGFLCVARRLALGTAGDTGDPAGSPCADLMLRLQGLRSTTSHRQAHHFFEFRSFSIRLSSESSATIFFSSEFSRWGSYGFRASETSMPPHFLRQR